MYSHNGELLGLEVGHFQLPALSLQCSLRADASLRPTNSLKVGSVAQGPEEDGEIIRYYTYTYLLSYTYIYLLCTLESLIESLYF